jgi:hypothetical protein
MTMRITTITTTTTITITTAGEPVLRAETGTQDR